jgi:pimeloyl-ACP methyl ester carboxylesterase
MRAAGKRYGAGMNTLSLLLLGLALLAVLGGWALRWLRHELTPERLAHPAALAPDAQWLRIHSANDKQLAAQWWPASDACGAVVLMHGWGGNGSQLHAAARALHAQGWSVLLPDARCHGRSDDDSFSSLPRFAQDLSASVDWLRTAPQGASGQAVVLLGHSVGAAAALLCATWRNDLSAVISVSAFAHPEQVMRRWLAAYRVPFWPLGWGVNRYIEHVIGHRFDDIAPLHTIARLKLPVLLIHGQQDEVVPLMCAQQLQAAAPHAQTLFCAGRHDGFDDEVALYANTSRWLQQAVNAPAPTTGAGPH